MSKSPKAVVDASVAVSVVLRTPQSQFANNTWDRLQHELTSIYVPSLWRYEVTSVIHKYLYDGYIKTELAEHVLDVTLALVEHIVVEDLSLCRAAFRWASRLNQKPAYDGFYIALAESLEAPFWTADRRLANNAYAVGANWVHWFGE